MRLYDNGLAAYQENIKICKPGNVYRYCKLTKNTIDTYRTRTCAGEPKRFLVFRLNHSAKVSWLTNNRLFQNIYRF